jgi:hypothetical protein
MTLPTDDLFGSLYLSEDAFIQRARSFGVSVAEMVPDDLTPTLAVASRLVESHTGRRFLPDAVSETHKFDQNTRRVSVNQPPVMELVSYQIEFAPGAVATFRPSDVVVNNQENYLELASLALATGIAGVIYPVGITDPLAQVTYKSYQDVPSDVAAATGFIAARLLQQAEANELLPAGLSRSKVGSEDLSRAGDEQDIPLMAARLLRRYQRLACA